MWQPILRFLRQALGLSALWQQQAKLASVLQGAKQLAVAQDWAAAIRGAESILEQEAPRSMLKRWFWTRLIQPIQREAQYHCAYWTSQADAEYDTILSQTRWLAFMGQFQGAIDRLEPAQQAFFRLEGKQHLEALYRAMKYRNAFHLALLAEQSGQWTTALDLYERLLVIVPEIQGEVRFRRAIIAIKAQHWEEANQSLGVITAADINNLRATALLAYVEQENTPIQNDSSRTNLQVLQQAAFEAGQAKNWEVCTQKLGQIWAMEGSYGAIHRWSIAAYYCAIEQPTWHCLETCLISRNMALANLSEDSTLLPADQIELTTQLKQQTFDLIQAIDNSELAQHLIHCNAIDELAMAESQAALYWQTLRITPMIYRRYSTIASAMPELPGNYLGSLYTDWAEAVLLCQQGKVGEAKQHYPETRPTRTPAERYAECYLSYHEGCDYLIIQPGGYLRWREAKQPLSLAQPEIRDSVLWQDHLNDLFEAYYPALWEAGSRQEFTQFWVDLLNTSTAHFYFQTAHDN